MRVLVCGGRDFDDALTLELWLEEVHIERGITLLIEGGARGADYMARKFAEGRGIPVKTFQADWKRHGKAAGAIRNKQMLDDGSPNLVVAFDGGRGTANMVQQAQAAGIEVLKAFKVTASR